MFLWLVFLFYFFSYNCGKKFFWEGSLTRPFSKLSHFVVQIQKSFFSFGSFILLLSTNPNSELRFHKPQAMRKSRKVYYSRKPKPNWLDMPSDGTAKILSKLGAIEILMSAHKVCTAWRKICKDPEMWHTINMWNLGDLHSIPYSLDKMCRHAIDCSTEHLVLGNYANFW